jgi:hypothetical protein
MTVMGAVGAIAGDDGNKLGEANLGTLPAPAKDGKLEGDEAPSDRSDSTGEG